VVRLSAGRVYVFERPLYGLHLKTDIRTYCCWLQGTMVTIYTTWFNIERLHGVFVCA
jgi:hypothetical protein